MTQAVGAFGNTDGDGIAQGETAFANATQIVQAWADGEANNGFAVQTGLNGTANGWAVATSSNPNLVERPQLSVSYIAGDDIQRSTFQPGLGGYNSVDSTVISKLPDGTTEIIDGETEPFTFLDGPNDTSANGSADEQLNIRFGDLFVSEGGSVPDNANILSAKLVLTTTIGESVNAESGEPFDASQLLVPFDDTTGFDDFGGNGPDEIDGEVGPILDQVLGGILGSQAFFDVTDAIENFLAGDTNFGFNVQASDINETTTNDGWEIYLPAAADIAFRPQLLIDWVVDDDTRLPGDANGDGTVNLADFGILRANFGSTMGTFMTGDFNDDGLVNLADFGILRANFGSTADAPLLDAWFATVVPEPTTLAIAGVAGLGLLRRRRA